MSEPQTTRLEDQRVLVKALRDSSRYTHAVGRIDVVQTHKSWVVLTGPFAYKVKKAVRFPFVDWSTVEQRRHFCEKELRLNRRFAPSLYLEVVSISGTPHSPILGGTGAPFEYAVKMKQFPADAKLVRLLEQYRIKGHHLDRFATDLAALQANATVAMPETPFGSPERISAHVMKSLKRIRRFLETDRDTKELEKLQSCCRSLLVSARQKLEDRRDDDFIREGHGRLHAGNLLFIEDRLVPIDCLEFSHQDRWIDVASDVASMFMDLIFRCRSDLAHRFLSAWLEASGDYAALEVLRLYLVCHTLAHIRITCPRLSQHGNTTAHERSHGPVADKLHLVRAQLCIRRTGPLIVMHGVSGSGKSHLAKLLVETTGAVLVSSDVERRRLPEEKAQPSQRSNESQIKRIYARLLELSTGVAAAGWPVIVDATFLRRSDRERFRTRARAFGLPFRILAVDAPKEVLRERLQRRGGFVSFFLNRDPPTEVIDAFLERQLESREPLAPEERRMTVSVDTSQRADPVSIAAKLLTDG